MDFIQWYVVAEMLKPSGQAHLGVRAGAGLRWSLWWRKGRLEEIEEQTLRRLNMVRVASGRQTVLLSINSLRHASFVDVALALFELENNDLWNRRMSHDSNFTFIRILYYVKRTVTCIQCL